LAKYAKIVTGDNGMLKTKNLTFLFFLIYLVLMVSLIFFAMNHNNKDSDSTKLTTKPQIEVSDTFSKELKAHEEKVKQKEIERANRWKPSKTFVIVAISISSFLDIIIILLWAKHENKKREGNPVTPSKRWTNQKWFWNVVALGIVQPKNNKLVISWVNLVVFLVAMYFLKNLFFSYLD
jgi:hypothetical protein